MSSPPGLWIARRRATAGGLGSAKPPLPDAQARLQREGLDVAVIRFTHIWPFPAHLVRPLLQRRSVVIAVEQNYSGQLADLMQQECLIETRRVPKYNGRPLYTADITGGVRQILAEGNHVVRWAIGRPRSCWKPFQRGT